MAYTRQTWVNGSAPYLNATNLNNLEAGVETLDDELGVNPSGTYATVAARLSAIEAALDAVAPPPTTTSPYGTSYLMNGLGNQVIGGSGDLRGAFRFKAPKSGNVTAIRAWFKNAAGGYGAGTGGTIRYSLQGDSANKPSGTIITSGTATGTVGVPIGTTSPDNRFDLRSFDSAGAITAGSLYYIVFENLDADPVANFLSMNCTHTIGLGWIDQPRTDLSTWHQTLGDAAEAGTWTASSTYYYQPILELTFDDGSHWGQGYMEPEIADEGRINGTSYKVRERFTVSGVDDRTVAGVALRIGMTSGSGNLVATLQDAGGTTIDTATISTSSATVEDPDDEFSSDVIVSGTFASSQTLTAGGTYFIQFSTDASTSMWTRGIQNGSGYGFTSESYFSDGYAQKTSNGGTAWATFSGLGEYGDLQFYFTT